MATVLSYNSRTGKMIDHRKPENNANVFHAEIESRPPENKVFKVEPHSEPIKERVFKRQKD